jgi:predicted RNA-binding protein YlxR (DUF448 family)
LSSLVESFFTLVVAITFNYLLHRTSMRFLMFSVCYTKFHITILHENIRVVFVILADRRYCIIHTRHDLSRNSLPRNTPDIYRLNYGNEKNIQIDFQCHNSRRGQYVHFKKFINNSRGKYKRNECLINVCKSDKDLS